MICGGLTAPGLIASVAGTPPHFSVTGGVAIVIGAAWWQIHESREQAKEKSPVSFLLDLRDALTPQQSRGGCERSWPARLARGSAPVERGRRAVGRRSRRPSGPTVAIGIRIRPRGELAPSAGVPCASAGPGAVLRNAGESGREAVAMLSQDARPTSLVSSGLRAPALWRRSLLGPHSNRLGVQIPGDLNPHVSDEGHAP